MNDIAILILSAVVCITLVVLLVKLSAHQNVKRFYKWLLK